MQTNLYIQKHTKDTKTNIYKNKPFYIQKNVLYAKQKCYIQQAAKTCNVQQQK